MKNKLADFFNKIKKIVIKSQPDFMWEREHVSYTLGKIKIIIITIIMC